MMLLNAHGPVPIATFATVATIAIIATFPRPKKEMIPWLCTSITSPSLRNQAKRKRALESPQKELHQPRYSKSDLQELFSRTLVSIGFVCFAIC